MIPKKIHYCWFGCKNIPDDLIKYISGWKDFCPDYEFVLWDEKNFDITSIPFVKSAYDAKKFAFVADYVRAYALYHYGGIYLDTDVELRKKLDGFVTQSAFTGFESKGLPFTALWAAEKGHLLSKKVMNYYEAKTYTLGQQTNTNIVSDILMNDFKIDPLRNEVQIGRCGECEIKVYPSEYFCIDLHTSYAVHHFYGSWLPNKSTSTKDSIMVNYHLERIGEINNAQVLLLKKFSRQIGFLGLMKVIIYFAYYKLVPRSVDSWIRDFLNR